MNVKEAIEKRQSVRSYKDKNIPEKVLNEVLDAARLAPSGNNAQPSRFYVVKTEEDKKKLKENDIFHQDFVYEAPAIIVCCSDPTAYPKNKDGWDSEDETRAVRDISIASSFLVLRATELGLGTCYIGWVKKEEIKKVLGIPEKYVVPYVIPIGYPDEEPDERGRKPLEEIIL